MPDSRKQPKMQEKYEIQRKSDNSYEDKSLVHLFDIIGNTTINKQDNPSFIIFLQNI